MYQANPALPADACGLLCRRPLSIACLVLPCPAPVLQVLRPFHDDNAKLQAAVDHLIDIGFMARRDVLRAGGVNMLWGLLLQVGQGRGRLREADADRGTYHAWHQLKAAWKADTNSQQTSLSEQTCE